jgi:hypothetical protein
MTKYLVALGAAASITGVAPQVAAQDFDAKDVAIAMCMKQAERQFPHDNVTGQGARAVVYKACMNAGGYKP